MDRILVALRAEKGREGKKLAKLVNRRNKSAGRGHDSSDHPRDGKYVCAQRRKLRRPSTGITNVIGTRTPLVGWHGRLPTPTLWPIPIRSPAHLDHRQYAWMDEQSSSTSFHFTVSPGALQVANSSTDETPTKHTGCRAAFSRTGGRRGIGRKGQQRKTIDYEFEAYADTEYDDDSGRNERKGTRWGLRRKNSRKNH
jgi:hypothetical protein